MRNMLVISLSMMLWITGCIASTTHLSSSESIECERLKVLFNNLEEQNMQTVVFFSEDVNEPVDEVMLQEFKGMILHLAGCCTCRAHPLAEEWMECNRLECIWKHLEEENVQRIAFYGQILEEDTERPEDWYNLWAEINEPEKIKKVIKLLHKAIKKEKNKFANEDLVMSVVDRMQIITDRHKFVIPISYYREAVRGIGWTSYELRKKLREWGLPEPKKPHSDIKRSSIQEHADALAPGVRVIQEQTLKLMAQHRWLKRRFEKCIERLETERGLEPIPRKSSTEKLRQMGYPAPKTAPNVAEKFAPVSEPFYVPYQGPKLPAWPVDKQRDIRKLIALVNLQSLTIAMYMYSSGDWIENFEKRLQRIDANQP